MPDQNKTHPWGDHLARILLLAGFGYLLTRACIEFYLVAWGSGVWLGEFSPKWAALFLVFSLFSAFCLATSAVVLWKQAPLEHFFKRIVSIRERLGILRGLLVVCLLALPVWFYQYTPWGVVFSGLHFRLLTWIMLVFFLGVLLQPGRDFLSWRPFLAGLLLTSVTFSVAAALIFVTVHPFSLGWSEGNRMWDYSMMFGRHLYDYPHDQEVYVLLDAGRQFLGGVLFLIPGLSIQVERLWVGLTTVFPYLLLGWAAFRFSWQDKKLWFLLGLWVFLFLKQGPIHPPLVVSATIVALVWRSPLWLAVPLILVTGYATEQSRFTWMFAPAIWIVMLEFAGAKLDSNGKVPASAWWRGGLLGLSGALGGYFGNSLFQWFKVFLAGLGNQATTATEVPPVAMTVTPSVTVSAVTAEAVSQPLLWYRLLPNATYGIGILLGLLIAIAPLVIVLVYWSVSKKWVLNAWQRLALYPPLLAFLAVGLVVSTKIGGGGDLHNLDMFLIGLLFTGVIAWENGGRQWLSQIGSSPMWLKGVLILLLAVPAVIPLRAMRSFGFGEQLTWLVTLTDVTDARDLEMLPPDEEVEEILQTIRQEVEKAKTQGDVLFMDQRQLLTFGYVQDVPFVPDYEKKILMNEAMSGSVSYFQPFYEALAARRFSLIVTEPLRAPVKDSSYQFGEENNAWVTWVVNPILCYYEPIETWKSVQVQLLVPIRGEVDCGAAIPIEGFSSP